MLDKDFNWCFNHENLFREWLTYIYDRINYYDMDNATIFDLWQEAKKYALQIANSKKPYLYLKIIDNDIITNFNHHSFLLWDFLYTMLVSSKNKNLELFAFCGEEAFKAYLSEKKIDLNSIDELDNKSLEDLNINMITFGQIESDYDYSLPDGGIKDETETDGTKTITKTKTDETITNETKTITKTKTEEESVDVILPKYNALNNDDFISAMQKAIKIGWIEKKEDGKYKWVGPKEIYKGSSDSVLTYFIGKALNLKTDVEKVKDPATDKMKEQLTYDSRQDAINRFPKEEINSLFGKSLIISQWKQIFTVQKKQVWREVIDKFFDENKLELSLKDRYILKSIKYFLNIRYFVSKK